MAYLLADAIANFAVGVISKSQSRDEADTSGFPVHPDLQALWASLLLVHLGDPDTITAFAMEDNELWLRHLLQQAYQGATTAYIFIITLPMSKLRIPILLMFICGFIKYIERTRSLYLASYSKLQRSLLPLQDPGPNYAEFMYELQRESVGQPINIFEEPDLSADNVDTASESRDLKLLGRAYEFFNTFQGLIVDLIFSPFQRHQSREFFLKLSAKDAIEVVEAELNFFYALLYTKASVVQGKCGYLLRFFSFTLNSTALAFFHLTDKKGFHNFDVGITYTFLLGAIVLDMIAFLMIIFSDWNAVVLTNSNDPPLFIRILRKLLYVNKRISYPDPNRHCPGFSKWFKKIVGRRWSESISQFNLVHYCLHPHSKILKSTIDMFGLTDMIDGLKYIKTVEFPEALGEFIFDELRLKSVKAVHMETVISSSRGNWVLQDEGCPELLEWISEVDFDESLLLWHVATDICLHSTESTSMNVNLEDGSAKDSSSSSNYDMRKFSNLLSEYMLYLLIKHPTMMSEVTRTGLTRFRATSAQAKEDLRVFKTGHKYWNLKKCQLCGDIIAGIDMHRQGQLGQIREGNMCIHSCTEDIPHVGCRGCRGKNELDAALHRVACNRIRNRQSAVKSGGFKESVLDNGIKLAKELNKLEEERKWRITSRVWVEMVSYAAGRCRASTHVAQLNKGGQLITLAWLLGHHFGLGNQFVSSQT